MGIEKKYIWIINWITRAIDSVEPIARFDFETYLPRVLKYGKYFRLLNSLNGCSEISNFELTEKAWSYNIDGAQSIDLIEELKKFDIVQFSSDRKKIQFLRNFTPYEIFSKILEEESFGNLNPTENIILEVFSIIQRKRFIITFAKKELYREEKTYFLFNGWEFPQTNTFAIKHIESSGYSADVGGMHNYDEKITLSYKT